MKKLFGLIVVLLLAILVWWGRMKPTPQPEYSVVTGKISDTALDIEYPKVSSCQFVNTDISALIATTTGAFRENFTQGSSLTIRYEVATGTSNILPIKFLIEEYDAGAAHPGHVVVTRNYDSKNQKILKLADLFFRMNYLNDIAVYVKPALIKKFEVEDAATDPEWVTTGTEPKAENYEAWLAESDGLRIIFNEYQVAPYAYGIPEILIPWTELKNLKK